MGHHLPGVDPVEPMEPSSDQNAINGANLRVEGLEIITLEIASPTLATVEPEPCSRNP